MRRRMRAHLLTLGELQQGAVERCQALRGGALPRQPEQPDRCAGGGAAGDVEGRQQGASAGDGAGHQHPGVHHPVGPDCGRAAVSSQSLAGLGSRDSIWPLKVASQQRPASSLTSPFLVSKTLRCLDGCSAKQIRVGREPTPP